MYFKTTYNENNKKTKTKQHEKIMLKKFDPFIFTKLKKT